MHSLQKHYIDRKDEPTSRLKNHTFLIN
jgi:hypothetical protein